MHNAKNRVRIVIPILVILVLLAAGAWYVYQAQAAGQNGPLEASGTIEAVEVVVAAEMSGRVVEVLAEKGERVEAGAPLLRLDDQLLQAQRRQAEAALQSAQAGLTTAQTSLDLARANLQLAEVGAQSAQIQYDITVDNARKADLKARTTAWDETIPSEFDQPVWYFDKPGEITAAEAEVEAARQALEAEKVSYASALDKASNEDLRQVQKRLADARAAFLVAEEVKERADNQSDAELSDFAETLFDAAKTELDAAQSEYDRMLSESANEDVLEARARLAVAQERYDTALDRLSQLHNGEDALPVQAALSGLDQAAAVRAQAEVSLRQAQASIEQTQKAIAQAQANLDALDVQLSKLTVYAPTSGVILSRKIEAGEVLQAGAPAMTIGQLDNLTITVYVPEDRYGQINLEQSARVSVDSFPGEQFDATVSSIADKAEFTPRNVQTAEGRRTTVFAVELSINGSAENGGAGKLKPGMPADVQFGR